MKDLEEYVKEVDKLYNSLDENTLRKPIGSKIFEKSQNIEDFINESYVNLNDYKESEDHSAKRAWYSLYLINDNLSWLIKEFENSKEDLPKELEDFKETTVKYLREYRGEARYDMLKEAKEDKRISNDNAIDLLNFDIFELKDNSELYGNIPPLEESINLLKDLASKIIDNPEENKGKRSQEFYKSILKKLDKFY